MGGVKSNTGLGVANGDRLREWKEIGGSGEQRLMLHCQTGKRAVMHRICLPHSMNLEEELTKYEYRRQQQRHLVEVYYAAEANVYLGCSGSTWIDVLVEGISHRLADIGGLSSSEGLYVLKMALMGFKTIQEMVGLVKVDDSLIGLNQDGRVRVWLNSNYALNHPEQHRHIPRGLQPSESRTNQVGMVDGIVRLVWAHVRQGDSQPFMGIYQSSCMSRSSRGMSFFEALNFLEDFLDESKLERLERIDIGVVSESAKQLQYLTPVVEYQSSNIPRSLHRPICTPSDISGISEGGSPFHPQNSLSEKDTHAPSTPILRAPQASNPVIRLSSSNKYKKKLTLAVNPSNSCGKERVQGLRITSRDQPKSLVEVSINIPREVGNRSERNPVCPPEGWAHRQCRLNPFSDRVRPVVGLSERASETHEEITPQSACLIGNQELSPTLYLGGQGQRGLHPTMRELGSVEPYYHNKVLYKNN